MEAKEFILEDNVSEDKCNCNEIVDEKINVISNDCDQITEIPSTQNGDTGIQCTGDFDPNNVEHVVADTKLPATADDNSSLSSDVVAHKSSAQPGCESLEQNRMEDIQQNIPHSDQYNLREAESFVKLDETVENHAPCDKFQPNLETNCEHESPNIKTPVCTDTLSSLARSYEDTEPVYLSGIVDHITRNDECKLDNDENDNARDDVDEELSVTDLMSNESIIDVFDKVYIMNSKGRHCTDVDVERNFHNDVENALTSSSSSSGVYSDTDDKYKFQSTKIKSSLRRPNRDEVNDGGTLRKKPKRSITFDSVSVYYFPRTQGFTCIPSQGGSTLGMSWNHSHSRKYSLGEHAAEQRRTHKQYCLQQFNAVKNWNEISNMSSEDSDSDEVISDSEVEYENYNFLQPIPTRERRAMLRAAGIHKIDSGEKNECRTIRLSREFCGCTCQVYCDPDRCVCAQAGIKCQVDRMNFPCSCTRDGCANENGRVEFNPVRVRTHYIHTLMRLEMEKKKEDEDEQRSGTLMSGTESATQLTYSSSSSSPLNLNSNLMNFSYHPNLQSWGSDYTNATSCFNFGNYAAAAVAAADQFSLASTIDSQYHQNISRLAVAGTNPHSSLQYCGQLSSEESDECSRMFHYNSMNSSIAEMDQNFLIRDLTNSLKGNESEINYDAESLIQVRDENFEPRIDGASQSENLDTSADVSEETEKEESDSENFGDIIKKTMVESIIA